jgi:hypothetical protein
MTRNLLVACDQTKVSRSGPWFAARVARNYGMSSPATWRETLLVRTVAVSETRLGVTGGLNDSGAYPPPGS